MCNVTGGLHPPAKLTTLLCLVSTLITKCMDLGLCSSERLYQVVLIAHRKKGLPSYRCLGKGMYRFSCSQARNEIEIISLLHAPAVLIFNRDVTGETVHTSGTAIIITFRDENCSCVICHSDWVV